MRLLLLFILSVLGVSSVRAEDWPRWRGIRGDGSWHAPNLPATWPQEGLKTVWSQSIGGGYAGPAVSQDLLYLFDLESPITIRKDAEPDGVERIRCFRADTGEEVWSHRYPVKYNALGGYNNGPRAMPTVHDGLVYTLGAVGHLNCFDARAGRVIWSRDLVKQDRSRVPDWGFAGCPIVDGDYLLVHTGIPGGALCCLDRKTGKEVWRALDDPPGYGTPVVIQAPSGRQVILWTPEKIHGVDLATGRPLWHVPYKVTYGVSIATPIFRHGIVLVSGYWEGSKAIRLGNQPHERELIWEESKNLRGLMAQPLERDGLVYLLDKGNGLTCFELATGKKLWDDEHRMTPRGRNPHASIIWLGDSNRILSLNAEGELILARLSREGYQEESRTRAVQGRVWSHPAFAGKMIFVRTDGGEQMGKGPFELKCLRLAD